MPKKAIDINRLQKLTERGRQRAERKEKETRLSEGQKYDREAKKLADDIIAGLPEKIKKEAGQGNASVTVYLPSGYQLHDRVKGNISSWCRKNDLTVTTKDVTFSDDSGPEETLVVSWPKKK